MQPAECIVTPTEKSTEKQGGEPLVYCPWKGIGVLGLLPQGSGWAALAASTNKGDFRCSKNYLDLLKWAMVQSSHLLWHCHATEIFTAPRRGTILGPKTRGGIWPVRKAIFSPGFSFWDLAYFLPMPRGVES